MHHKHASTSPSANSLCRDLGHEWLATTAANYRVCQRQRCRAAQRWQDERWINVAVAGRSRIDAGAADDQQHSRPQQGTLFV